MASTLLSKNETSATLTICEPLNRLWLRHTLTRVGGENVSQSEGNPGRAQILVSAQNRFWGDPTAWIMDLAGHVWTVAARVEETTEEVRTERWSAVANQLNRPEDSGTHSSAK